MTRLTALLTCLILILTAVAPGPAAALEIKGMRFGVHPEKTRLVIDMDQPAAFKAFMLADPVRLVIDAPTFNWGVGQIIRPAGHTIRDIRQGPNGPGVSRIVIDLEKPALIQSAFIMPRNAAQPDRLVIDYKTVAANAFAQSRGKMFGTLDTAAAQIITGTTTTTTTVTTNSTTTFNDGGATMPVPANKPVQPLGKPVPKSERPLIVLDAGHGGEDPGALGGNGLREKNITLAMARDLRAQLEATGRYRVHLTRDSDIFIRLSQRVAIARAKKADLFISLHADSINRAGVRGASIYTLSEKASDAETEKLAARENHADLIAGIDLSHEDADVANILVDLAMRDTMNQSKFFANKTVSMLRTGNIKTLDNPHRFAGFAVLKAPDIPSVLIELGYMSNTQESSMLSKPEYRARIASALVRGIDDYFETIGKN